MLVHVALSVASLVAAGVGLWHTMVGCPGVRTLSRAAQLEAAFLEWLQTSHAREQRVAESANRMARAAAQIDRKRRARAQTEEHGEQSGAEGEPGVPAQNGPATEAERAVIQAFLAS